MLSSHTAAGDNNTTKITIQKCGSSINVHVYTKQLSECWHVIMLCHVRLVLRLLRANCCLALNELTGKAAKVRRRKFESCYGD